MNNITFLTNYPLGGFIGPKKSFSNLENHNLYAPIPAFLLAGDIPVSNIAMSLYRSQLGMPT